MRNVLLTRHAAALLSTICLFFILGCRSTVSDKPIDAATTIQPPLGLPPVPFPLDNPPTAATINLGRHLFYEKRLSKDNSVSCATCHDPALDFTDGRSIAQGVDAALGTRNTPTALNSVYQPFQFWDGRVASLEAQSSIPMTNPAEMDQSHKVTVSKLSKNTAYQRMFAEAYGSSDITIARIQKALASFERTLLSGDSAFDHYQYQGDTHALTPSQMRGLSLFIDPNKGNCAACHTIGPQSSLFTDGKFHNIGVGVEDDGNLKDLGRYLQTKIDSDRGAFKTPTLRNVANTAPYMHDGSLQTLQQVVDFYAGGGNSNPYLDKEIKVIKLSGQERADLVEFLKSLTGRPPVHVGPPENQ
ncbi:cytochrome-c peroxidase [Edaphobacter flagellatus]|uniref:cytochrome-c peroxidase n=1 Tax=Edaphobacter flagellatus TaxID=1933044 RepID=UPI0021B47487|nr:cytochrome c peroxidase [Edaphobacter flagellatus]